MPANVARTGGNLSNGNFLPAVWSKLINSKYYAQTCLMNIANSKWEGEIKGQGSQVEIRVRPTILVNDYTANSAIQYQDLVDEKITLLLDKAKSFAFKVDDVDKVQSDINVMDEVTTDAGFQMKIAIEKMVFSTIYSDATNTIAQIALDKTNVIDWMVDSEVVLEENNMPAEDRWIIVPPKVAGLIQKSDLKNAAITGDDTSVLRKNLNNGRLGTIAGYTIYVSNNLTKTNGVYQCIAGHKSALTFASQLVKTETVRLQDRFADSVRGLNVYGYKTVLPQGLVYMPCTA